MVNKSKGSVNKPKQAKKEKQTQDEDEEVNELDMMGEGAFDEQDTAVCSAICWIPRIDNKPMQFKKLNKTNDVAADGDLPSDNEEEESDDDMEDDAEDVADKKVASDEENDFEDTKAVKSIFKKKKTLQKEIESAKNDEYLKSKSKDEDADEELSDVSDDLDEHDYVFTALVNEDFVTTLQVWIYEEDEHNWVVHHDLVMNNLGLCLEHISVPDFVNCCAVGTFSPDIEIWDIETPEVVDPLIILSDEKNKKKKQGKATLSLSWNKTYTQFLASGCEDASVKIWDVTRPQAGPVCVLSHHEDKVQVVQWNNVDSTVANVLLTAGFDGSIHLVDPRNDSDTLQFSTEKGIAIEAAQWNIQDSNTFACFSESGIVYAFDARNSSKPLFKFKSHAAGGDLKFMDKYTKRNMFATVDEGSVKFWDFKACLNNTNTSTLATPFHEMSIDSKLFTMGIYDALIAASGQTSEIFVAKILDNAVFNQ